MQLAQRTGSADRRSGEGLLPISSPPAVHRLTGYSLFGHPLYQQPALGGRLHWASTETAPDHAGHMEGALTAAERAAHAVLSTAPGRTVPAQ